MQTFSPLFATLKLRNLVVTQVSKTLMLKLYVLPDNNLLGTTSMAALRNKALISLDFRFDP